MVNCVLSGLFLKEKIKMDRLRHVLKVKQCLSVLQNWGLGTKFNPFGSQRVDFPYSVPGAEKQFA